MIAEARKLMPENIFDWLKTHGGDVGFDPPPPLESTKAHPGSKAKIAIIADAPRRRLWPLACGRQAKGLGKKPALLKKLYRQSRGMRGRK